MITGASPGLGKSTLARRLGESSHAADREVVVFLEAMIGDRVEFANVMATFRSTGAATRAELVEATRRFADTYRDRPVMVVQDMLLPYLPSLLAWGYADVEIVELFSEITAACAGVQLVQIHLDGAPARSLPRAIEREDASWLDWMIAKVSRYADVTAPVTDLASLIEYFEHARRRTHTLVASAPWPVVVIDADRGPDHALDDATAAVARIVR